jgi:glycosyltransferase involved in cell wall biosynthesis
MRTSVVMATFNGEAYLSEQLKSIIKNKPHQLVVVDDASTDSTIEIIKNTLKFHPDIELTIHVNEINQGSSLSFRKAIMLSSGDIIFLSDQDDYWMDNKIEVMNRLFDEDKRITMAYSDGIIVNKELRPIGPTIFGTRKHFKNGTGTNRTSLEVAVDPDIKGCTIAVRGNFARQLFAATNPDSFTLWGHDQWLALFSYIYGEVREIKMPLILHRFHDRNTSRGQRFSVFRIKQVVTYVKLIRSQPTNYTEQKYQAIIQHLSDCKLPADTNMVQAIQTLLSFSRRRSSLQSLTLISRLYRAIQLYREGLYDLYNGKYTMIRDIFLVRPMSSHAERRRVRAI